MDENVIEKIKDEKIIAIVRNIAYKEILRLGEALREGGINCIEVTFDQSDDEKVKDTLKSINLLSELGDFCVGAGTVITAEQADLAIKAGAEYIISPNVDEEVIGKTKELGKISIPGAFTATEIETAYKLGGDIIKVFPAGLLGAEYIRALKAPLSHIPLTAVGGINHENCGSFVAAGAVGIGVGGGLVSHKLVAEKRYDEITMLAKEYRRNVDSI